MSRVNTFVHNLPSCGVGTMARSCLRHAGAEEAPMSDRARDVWVEHLVTTYMNMSQPDWTHL